MKYLLVGINAKYIHTNIAIRSITKYVKTKMPDEDINFIEFTVNQSKQYILEEIFKLKPKYLAFSCYIWNIKLILEIISDYKKISPDTIIILGGPEVSYNSDKLLDEHSEINRIICLEGENAFLNLINGENPDTAQPVHMDEIPFLYDSFDYDKIHYYESSRGCPFNCSYCLSSFNKGVRFRSLEFVYKDLSIFLEAGIRQVKFVDRTFNCNKKHAFSIWSFLIDNDNGKTNFHFEISATLIDNDMIFLLKNARKGLFQFEIGVQSTNKETLNAIHRTENFDDIADVVKKISALGNIHQHLDLIAGLPCEDFDSFKRSFNDVFSLHPEQLQLGFLKVLNGSLLCDDKRIEHSLFAPYEVISTHMLSYEQIIQLKSVENMVEIFYNSTRFSNILAYMQEDFADSFSFFLALGHFFKQNNYHSRPLSKDQYYTILYNFQINVNQSRANEHFQQLCKFDMSLHEKPKKIPSWLTAKGDYSKLKEIKLTKTEFADVTIDGRILIFDYSVRDINGHADVREIKN